MGIWFSAAPAAADFFTVEVWTLRGLVRYHVFFVIKLAQRQVLKDAGIKVIQTRVRSPQQNG